MIALFGGTFNPVHNGHVALAREVALAYRLQRVDFVPSYLPVHRDEPQIPVDARIGMVWLAIQGYPELGLNDCEVKRAGPSFTVETLRQIRQQQPQRTICWLMGADSFNSFPTWKRPQEILQLANLIVCERPGASVHDSPFAEHFLSQDEDLKNYRAGKISHFAMQPNPCSSTQIRNQLAARQAVNECISKPVLDFIRQHQLYEN